MDVATIKSLREKHANAKFISIHFNTNYIASSKNHFIAWNDEKQLVSCIWVNADHYTSTQAPFSIRVTPYDEIHVILGYYD